MIKAHLPPEKSVYSLPRAVPGSPKPSRPHIPVRRPAAIPVPAPETTPGNHPPKLPPGTFPHPPGTTPEITHSCACSRTHLESISETSAHGTCSRKHPPRPKPSCTHPREPALKPSLQPPTLETIPGTISETTAPGTDLQTPALPGPSANRGISRVPRPSAPGRGHSRARISTGSDKIMPDNAKFSHNYS